MVTVYLKGNVLPDISDVYLGHTFTGTWNESGVTAQFFVDIKKSVIDVRCELERFEPEFRHWIYGKAIQLTKAVVNMFCFARGYGFMVFIHTFIGPDGQPVKVFLSREELRPLVTAYHVNHPGQSDGDPTDLYKAMILSVQEPSLFLAMDDLIATFTSSPAIVPVNCARALEGIRIMIAPEFKNKEKEKGWEQLRLTLNCSQTYIQFITEPSKGPRHADQRDVKSLSNSTLLELVSRMWILMNRFLEFKKRGGQPLPESEFPLLA